MNEADRERLARQLDEPWDDPARTGARAAQGRTGIFEEAYLTLAKELLGAPSVDVGKWHSQDVSGRPELVTREIEDIVVGGLIPLDIESLQLSIKPHLPFAEEQFKDRVSGEPLNPPPSARLWPWAHDHALDSGGQYSHTYPERFWPKRDKDRKTVRHGIRYPYGDLQDVVNLLIREPHTRQAYLPVFFPEDTGNVQNVRTPCSLGYHFLARRGKLNMTYFIRSVDFVRHFRDDVYMACRLCQWVVSKIREHHYPHDPELTPGTFAMHIVSLHCMEGDIPKLEKEVNVGLSSEN